MLAAHYTSSFQLFIVDKKNLNVKQTSGEFFGRNKTVEKKRKKLTRSVLTIPDAYRLASVPILLTN